MQANRKEEQLPANTPLNEVQRLWLESEFKNQGIKLGEGSKATFVVKVLEAWKDRRTKAIVTALWKRFKGNAPEPRAREEKLQNLFDAIQTAHRLG